VRLAVRRLLSQERFRAKAREIAAWSEGHDGAAAASDLAEEAARNATSRLPPARISSTKSSRGGIRTRIDTP
jgi:hypothetical protein